MVFLNPLCGLTSLIKWGWHWETMATPTVRRLNKWWQNKRDTDWGEWLETKAEPNCLNRKSTWMGKLLFFKGHEKRILGGEDWLLGTIRYNMAKKQWGAIQLELRGSGTRVRRHIEDQVAVCEKTVMASLKTLAKVDSWTVYYWIATGHTDLQMFIRV